MLPFNDNDPMRIEILRRIHGVPEYIVDSDVLSYLDGPESDNVMVEFKGLIEKYGEEDVPFDKPESDIDLPELTFSEPDNTELGFRLLSPMSILKIQYKHEGVEATIEKERIELIEKERIELIERIEKERIELIEKERIELIERIEKERIEKERIERIEKERIEKEHLYQRWWGRKQTPMLGTVVGSIRFDRIVYVVEKPNGKHKLLDTWSPECETYWFVTCIHCGKQFGLKFKRNQKYKGCKCQRNWKRHPHYKTGDKVGVLTILYDQRPGQVRIKCECVCTKVIVIPISKLRCREKDLRLHRVLNCGCLDWATKLAKPEPSSKGKQRPPEVIRKMRLGQIKRIERSMGHQLYPTVNEVGCDEIDKFGKEHGFTFRHGRNGGEFRISELGYWVDGYDEENNVVVEYLEKHHFKRQLMERDARRRKEIMKHLHCRFIEIKYDGKITIYQPD